MERSIIIIENGLKMAHGNGSIPICGVPFENKLDVLQNRASRSLIAKVLTEVGGECGYDTGKQVKGRKRHILVDTLGLLLLVVVTTATLQDASSANVIGPRLAGKLPRLKK